MTVNCNAQTVINWMRKQEWYMLYKSNTMMNFRTPGSVFREEDVEDYVTGAFNWDDAPEGFDYWNRINESFLDFLEMISE
jgi:hypothetical protein